MTTDEYNELWAKEQEKLKDELNEIFDKKEKRKTKIEPNQKQDKVSQ
jgi:hypothetical protein